MNTKLTYESTDCSGGINQNSEKIRENQCADARNVWAVDGKVVQRPGCLGVVSVTPPSPSLVGVLVGASEDVSTVPPTVVVTVGPLTLSNFVGRATGVAGDHWYIGYTGAAQYPWQGFYAALSAVNTNDVHYIAEYWNGSNWKYLPVTERATATSTSAHLSSATTYFLFVPPADWVASDLTDTATGTVYTRGWLRFTLLAGTAGALDAAVVIDTFGTLYGYREVCGIFSIRFPGTTRYLAAARSSGITTYHFYSWNVHWARSGDMQYTQSFRGPGGPVSIAVVPQFYEVFVAQDQVVSAYGVDGTIGGYAGCIAEVDNREFVIGPGMPFDRDSLPQLAQFPSAKVIVYFQQMLWALDENDNVCWSGFSPYHKVWPMSAIEPLAEADSSPATGMLPLGENMLVYKNDSIWKMTFRDFDDFGIPRFIPVKTDSTVGATAHATIKNVRGHGHVFLADEGLYAFDGVRERRVSLDPDTGEDRLENFFSRVTKGKRAHAVAAVWKKESCYLLSLSLDGAEYNTTTLVWDYLNDAFWIWTGFEAQFWMEDEDAADMEVLYFADHYGHLYQLDAGNDDDHGAVIDSWVLTRELGKHIPVRKTLEIAEIDTENTCTQLSVKSVSQGKPVALVPARTVNTRSPSEVGYGVKKFGEEFNWISDRTRYLKFQDTCDHVQLHIAGYGKGSPLELSAVRAGFLLHPSRRK